MDESIAAFLSGLDLAASSRDLDRYMELFSPREDVLFVFNGEVFVGAEAIAATHWDSWSQLTRLEFHTGPILALQIGLDCAFLTATGHSSRTYRSGESFEGEYVLTLGLERYGTDWRIRQKHESIPPGAHLPGGLSLPN
jgi:ketosteroid isomerase-like protein